MTTSWKNVDSPRPSDVMADSIRNASSSSSGYGPPLVRIQDVHKRFGALEVLRGVSMEVCTGEVVVIIGPSGSGKSTLLRCVCGLEKLDKGTIYVDGQRVANTLTLRGKVGMVFQDLHTFPHMSVLDNISLGPRLVKKFPKAKAERIANELLELVDLKDKRKAYPGELSGGQRQRVAIARSLAMGPKLMLFDEITSALDRELVMDVLQLMKKLAEEGMTMLVVTHELWFAANVAHRVVFFDEGRIVEEGPPGEIFSSPREKRTRSFIGEISMPTMINPSEGR